MFSRRQGNTIPQNSLDGWRVGGSKHTSSGTLVPVAEASDAVASPAGVRQSIGEMRVLAPWAALLVLGSAAASGQSLGEVAAKEKARRAQTGGGETVPVIDDERLSQARGDGLSLTGARASQADSDEPSDAAESDDAEATEHGLSEKEIRDYRQTWARVWAARLAAAEQEVELAGEAVYQCQSAAHYVFVPLAIDCNGVYERRAIAEYRLKEIRQNRFNWELLVPESKRPPPQQ